jgi:hypothetical protein
MRRASAVRKPSGTLVCEEVDELDDSNWAAAHYRVERSSTGLMLSERKLKKVAEQAVRFGDPTPEAAHDVVRIFDRAGNAVFERDWGRDRPSAMSQEAQIVDDLLRLDVLRFRAKWSIAAPLEAEPPGPEAPGAS